MRIFFLLLAVVSSAFGATTHYTDGTYASMMTKIGLAVSGDIIDIPAGNHEWDTQIPIPEKAVHVRGAGSGRVLANSRSSVLIGTGEKIFTLTTEAVASIAARRSSISGGQTLKIWRTGGAISQATYIPPGSTGAADDTPTPWMRGTVTSLVGNTLTMNITSTNQTGTHAVWVVTSEALTTVTINHTVPGSSCGLDFELPATGQAELSGIRFIGVGTNPSRPHLVLVRGNATVPILIHDCFFDEHGGNGIRFNINSGIVWNTDFCPLPGSPGNNSGIIIKGTGADTWLTPSTMGTADTTGKRNIYVEDCTFSFSNDAFENDDDARTVIRNCLFNNAGIGAHGTDTSSIGMRHVEMYDNAFIRDSSLGDATYSMGGYFIPRGGTGLFTGNTLENGAMQFQIAQLGRDGAFLPNGDGIGWSSGDGQVPQYPVPRQVGSGYINGTRLDGMGNPNAGDLEPLYIWSNTGTIDITLSNGADGTVASPDNAIDYIAAGRDYIISGTAKPGWTRYTYPHPLRNDLDQVAAPSFSPVAGTYGSAQSVTITSGGATIRYTVDGSTPTSSSGTVYAGPVSISVTTTLKAIAYDGVLDDSEVTTGVYTISGGSPVARHTPLNARGLAISRRR